MSRLYLGTGESGAVFSECRQFRYSLGRRWNTLWLAAPSEMCVFVGLNPSKADERKNDNTIRRCINYARDWGYGGMVMLNLFAYMATDPEEMESFGDPIGIENDAAIRQIARVAGRVVACWGTHGAHLNRGSQVGTLLESAYASRVYCLGLTSDGHPKHPLYLPKDLEPTLWQRGTIKS